MPSSSQARVRAPGKQCDSSVHVTSAPRKSPKRGIQNRARDAAAGDSVSPPFALQFQRGEPRRDFFILERSCELLGGQRIA